MSIASSLVEPLVISLKETRWSNLWQVVSRSLPNNFRILTRPDFASVPFSQIGELLEQQRCNTVVVGFPFRDDDYVFDYRQHLSDAHEDFGRDCVRLHFFADGVHISPPTIVEDIHKIANESPDAYLGYMVIRPTYRNCVGRTIIKCPPASAGGAHIHVKAKYTANLFGAKLRVQGVPFMQQDGSSHICAGAALWAMCYDVHRRYHTARLYPSELVRIATQFEPRREHNWGLTATQISQVLRHIGCVNDCCVYLRESSKFQRLFAEFVDFVYGYVQSNIPVLLGYWLKSSQNTMQTTSEAGHMVLVVGHNLAEQPRAFIEKQPITWNSEYVQTFYCQDDQRGPYQSLAVGDLPLCANASLDTTGTHSLANAAKIIAIPAVSRSVNMTYRDAKRRVGTILTAGRTELRAALDLLPSPDPLLASDDQPLEEIAAELAEIRKDHRFRMYLQLTRRFRTLLFSEDGRTNLPKSLVDAYCRAPLPTHLFVCDILRPTPRTDGRFELAGELIFDATAPHFAHDYSLIALRIEEITLIRVRGKWETLTCDRLNGSSLAPRNVDDY